MRHKKLLLLLAGAALFPSCAMIAPSTAEVMADISTGDLFLAIVADIERFIDFLAVHGWWFL